MALGRNRIGGVFADECPALLALIRKRVEERDQRAAKEDIAPCKARSGRRKQSNKLFLRSEAWLAARKSVFDRDGRVCAKCGSTTMLQVDHVIPRSKAPEMELDIDNLRVLCWPCNKAKGTKIEVDFPL